MNHLIIILLILMIGTSLYSEDVEIQKKYKNKKLVVLTHSGMQQGGYVSSQYVFGEGTAFFNEFKKQIGFVSVKQYNYTDAKGSYLEDKTRTDLGSDSKYTDGVANVVFVASHGDFGTDMSGNTCEFTTPPWEITNAIYWYNLILNGSAQTSYMYFNNNLQFLFLATCNSVNEVKITDVADDRCKQSDIIWTDIFVNHIHYTDSVFEMVLGYSGLSVESSDSSKFAGRVATYLHKSGFSVPDAWFLGNRTFNPDYDCDGFDESICGTIQLGSILHPNYNNVIGVFGRDILNDLIDPTRTELKKYSLKTIRNVDNSNLKTIRYFRGVKYIQMDYN